jgi:hypothetical protein
MQLRYYLIEKRTAFVYAPEKLFVDFYLQWRPQSESSDTARLLICLLFAGYYFDIFSRKKSNPNVRASWII